MLRQKILEKTEKLRMFLMELSIYYLIIMPFCGFVFFVFVFCPVYFFMHGFIVEFFEDFIIGGIWFFLLFSIVSLFLIALLTAVKMLLAGFTREEVYYLTYVVLLFLGYAMFFVLFTNGLFA
jgi:hypothetical protein